MHIEHEGGEGTVKAAKRKLMSRERSCHVYSSTSPEASSSVRKATSCALEISMVVLFEYESTNTSLAATPSSLTLTDLKLEEGVHVVQ